MSLRSLVLLASCAAVGAFSAPGTASLAKPRCAGATMQFWKKGDSSGKKTYSRDVYDDEVNTFAGRFSGWNAEKDSPVGRGGKMTDLERAGFTEDGRDLATDGLLIYAAFIPFLLLAFGLSTGAFSFGYENGNF